MNTLLKITSVISVSIVLQACAPSNNQGSDAGTWWRVTPVDIAETQNASSNNESLFASPSTSQAAIDTSSIVPAGRSYRVFTADHATRAAIYSCGAGGTDQFTSLDKNCEGHQNLGLIGYVDRASSGFAPTALYRCAGFRVRYDVTNPSDCLNNGLQVEGILGYVP